MEQNQKFTVGICACLLIASGCAAQDLFGPPHVARPVAAQAPLALTQLTAEELAPRPAASPVASAAAVPVSRVLAAARPSAQNQSRQSGLRFNLVSASAVPARQPGPAAPPKPVITTLQPNQDLFEVVSEKPGIVVIDFYADWCGPCREQGRLLHEMEGYAQARGASVVKVNVDEHEALAERLKVSSLPMLLVLKDGRLVDAKKGLADRKELAAFFSK